MSVAHTLTSPKRDREARLPFDRGLPGRKGENPALQLRLTLLPHSRDCPASNRAIACAMARAQRPLIGTFRRRLPLSSGWGRFPPLHVDLERRDDEFRHCQRLVARLANLHELVLADAVLHVDVVRPLLGDRGLPTDLATIRPVVVAHEKPRLTGQRQHALDGAVECPCVAAREVGARRAAVRHEQRIADEGGIANHMRHAGGRMARRMHGEGLHRADL